MQTITKICLLPFVKRIGNFKVFLMLLLFASAVMNNAVAQNSCSVTGVGPAPPFPLEIIVSCANGPNLSYQSNPSLPSTYSWSIPINTTGASIVGSTTSQVVVVNPGSNAGSFFVVCMVTAIASPFETNQCAVSVAVFKPVINGVPASRCGPGTITLGATGCTGIVDWYDAPSGGNLVNTGSSFTTNVSATTSYWATCTINVTPSPPHAPLTCNGPRVEIVATVNPLPVCAITGGSNTVCGGSTTTWSATAGMTSYAWTGPGGFTASTQSITIGTAGTYTVTITNANGCQSTCARTLEVNPPPSCTITGGSNSVCAGSTTTWSATAGMASYAWTGPGGFTANTQSITISTDGTYNVTITDANGCQNTCQRTLTVNPPPSCSITGGSNSVCAGSTTIWSASAGMASYAWTGPGGFTANTQTITIGTAGTYIVTITDANGCQNTCQRTLTVNTVSCIMSTPSATAQCSTAGNTVSGTVTGGTGPYTCTASFDAAGTAAGWTVTNCSVTGSNISVTYTAGTAVATVLTVNVTDANGCQSQCTITLNCQSNSQGCSPGFWKNHTTLWNQTSDFVVRNMPAGLKFTTTTNYFTYFGLAPGANGFPATMTMHGAISQGGGQCKALSRHAVSALLSSAGGLNIPYPTGTSDFTSLYNAIRAALLSGNCSGAFASQLSFISDQDHSGCDELKRLYASARPGNASIKLYDMNGNLVNGVPDEGNAFQRKIESGSLQAGIYLVRIQNGDAISNKKLVITK